MGLAGRVAFLSEHASPVALLGSQDAGGQNVYVDEVSRNLASRGWHVDVFTRRTTADDPEVVNWSPGVRIVNIDFGPPGPLLKDDMWPHMPAFRDRVLGWIRRHDARYDALHGNFWMSGWVAAELGTSLGVSVAQIFHATGITKRRNQGDADSSPFSRVAVEREVVQRVDRIIVQCPAEHEEMIDEYAAAPDKLVVIPSAVNIDRYRPVPQREARHRIGIEQDGLVIAYVGRMLPRKDPRNIARALALLVHQHGVNARLLLVGGESVDPDPRTTPEIGVLQQIGRELNVLDHMIFTGKRQPDQLRDYYSAADVAVTTPWYEPFGLTPLEAMACGRPVIGSAVGGITYTVADGETGLLVPPRNPEALAEALCTLLADPDRRTRMGIAARERVERDFTWGKVAERTIKVYESLARPDRDRSTNETVHLAAQMTD
jgi:glycosyltransferase involved in cell wall biosynthesis